MKTKVHALAAIDSEGRWMVYGFQGLDDADHLHETGVTEDLGDTLRIFRVEFEIEAPGAIEAASGVTVAEMEND